MFPCGKAWAVISGKYIEASPDPAKWKTNFRCALKSTKRFQLVSESKDPDPHHVYKIHPHITTAANPPADTSKDCRAKGFVEVLWSCVLFFDKSERESEHFIPKGEVEFRGEMTCNTRCIIGAFYPVCLFMSQYSSICWGLLGNQTLTYGKKAECFP